jgi:hypothetical protein
MVVFGVSLVYILYRIVHYWMWVRSEDKRVEMESLALTATDRKNLVIMDTPRVPTKFLGFGRKKGNE